MKYGGMREARVSVVGWGTTLQAGRLPVRLPLRSLELLIDLRLTQPLTETTTRNLPGDKKRPALKVVNLAAICGPVLYKMWEPRRLTTLWTFTACYRDNFTFTFLWWALPLSNFDKATSHGRWNRLCKWGSPPSVPLWSRGWGHGQTGPVGHTGLTHGHYCVVLCLPFVPLCSSTLLFRMFLSSANFTMRQSYISSPRRVVLHPWPWSYRVYNVQAFVNGVSPNIFDIQDAYILLGKFI
jgi:hypothetical protein